mgnify:CR=1 FL=1
MVGTFKEWQDLKVSNMKEHFGLTGEAISESKYGGKCVQFEPDPIVARTMKRMGDRSAEGIRKYGCTMEREDVTTTEWIDHAIEEQLDAAIYLERLKDDLVKLKPAMQQLLDESEYVDAEDMAIEVQDEVVRDALHNVIDSDLGGWGIPYSDEIKFKLAAQVLLEWFGTPGVDFDVEE